MVFKSVEKIRKDTLKLKTSQRTKQIKWTMEQDNWLIDKHEKKS